MTHAYTGNGTTLLCPWPDFAWYMANYSRHQEHRQEAATQRQERQKVMQPPDAIDNLVDWQLRHLDHGDWRWRQPMFEIKNDNIYNANVAARWKPVYGWIEA